jgi:hypothetical protein
MVKTKNSKMRIIVIGPRTFFENHFPENWQSDPDVKFLHNEWNLKIDVRAINTFAPDLILIFRPELITRSELEAMSGIKIGFLSEPLNLRLKSAGWLKRKSSEVVIRRAAMNFNAFSPNSLNFTFSFERIARETEIDLNLQNVIACPLPIDTSCFHSIETTRDIDIFFIGKPTAYRTEKLDSLRWSKYKYVWVAHGLSGPELAHYLRRSKIVLNIHADGSIAAYEPRIDLALACGAKILSEPLDSARKLSQNITITEIFDDINIDKIIDRSFINDFEPYSTRRFLEDLMSGDLKSESYFI